MAEADLVNLLDNLQGPLQLGTQIGIIPLLLASYDVCVSAKLNQLVDT